MISLGELIKTDFYLENRLHEQISIGWNLWEFYVFANAFFDISPFLNFFKSAFRKMTLRLLFDGPFVARNWPFKTFKFSFIQLQKGLKVFYLYFPAIHSNKTKPFSYFGEIKKSVANVQPPLSFLICKIYLIYWLNLSNLINDASCSCEK